MSSHRTSERAGFRLVLIGVHAHAVSDIDCR
ncbi:Ms4533A family Cys-rich leader peptide [Streptomyces himalayensis]|nr:Ms4533A family Cys-rich leader peptide [Streptomyces himalayensis]